LEWLSKWKRLDDDVRRFLILFLGFVVGALYGA
jgi:uncharacterized membrane protein YoaK (UPF0700 family)